MLSVIALLVLLADCGPVGLHGPVVLRKSLGEGVIVTASVSEYVSLRNATDGEVEILSIEDLILG